MKRSLLASICLASLAAAQQPSLWETNIADHDARVAFSAATGGLVFVSGSEILDEKNFVLGGLIAAFDVKTGELAWIKQGDPATGTTGGATSDSTLGPLVLSKGVVVAGGGRMVSGPDLEGAVRAYDQKSGALLWAKQYPTGGYSQVAVAGKVAFAATTLGATTQDKSIQVTAYDLFTGDVRWEKTYGTTDQDATVAGLAATGKHVALVGNQKGIGVRNLDWLVRVLDAKTGELEWDDVIDESGGSDLAQCVAIKGKRLYVGGGQTPEGGDLDELLAAYNLATGKPLWSHSDALSGDASISLLATSGGTVTSLSIVGFFDYLARSHKAKDGVVRWDTPLGFDLVFVAVGFATSASRCIVSTTDGTVALDAKTGLPAWDSPFPGFSAFMLGKRVFLAGGDDVAAFPVK